MRLGRFAPGIALLRTHRGAGLRGDVVGGVVLAALLVPQGLAYGELAGVPAVTGLYATLVPLLVYFLLGPSRILVLGPDSAVSPLVAAAIVPLAATGDPSERIALAGLLAMLVGAIMLAGGLARFGFVTELLSTPVRLGYLMGIAVTVIAVQLPKLLGFSVEAENLLLLIILGGVLLAIPLLAAREAKREAAASEPAAGPEPGVPAPA